MPPFQRLFKLRNIVEFPCPDKILLQYSDMNDIPSGRKYRWFTGQETG